MEERRDVLDDACGSDGDLGLGQSLDQLEMCLRNWRETATLGESEASIVNDKLRQCAVFIEKGRRIASEECYELERQLADELQVNSERLRTRSTLRHDADKYRRHLERSHELMEKMREREAVHRRVVGESETLQRVVDEGRENIVQLRRHIRQLQRKMMPANGPLWQKRSVLILQRRRQAAAAAAAAATSAVASTAPSKK